MSTDPACRIAADSPDSEGLVEFLRQPSSYPVSTATVELRETHISWVFLTERSVYKLKKPVCFDFLDFSTVERRRWACEQEVTLNRRLAPNIYVGTVPITRDSNGRLEIGGQSAAVDWLVAMRRLDADAALDQRILAGSLTEADADRVSDVLVDFYQRLPPVTVRTVDYRHAVQQHISDNERQLLSSQSELPPDQTRRIHAAQLRLLQLVPDLLDDRVRDGRIVDGHGDLRPEHIYLTPTPVVIDCIEFNPELRRVDVVDELAFLEVECERLGAGWVGERIRHNYTAVSCDSVPAELTQFYQSYRASVRAKVCTLRAGQLATSERAQAYADARRYLQLADQAASCFGKPFMLVIRGLPGTGKSTLAEALSEQLDCDLLQTDVIRRELFGAADDPSEYNQGRYQLEHRLAVYAEMFRRANSVLSQGMPVILDGTFLTPDLRHKALQLAERRGVKLLVFQCCCPEGIARSRIAERARSGKSDSETKPSFYPAQHASEVRDSRSLPGTIVDTGGSLDEAKHAVCSQLRHALFP